MSPHRNQLNYRHRHSSDGIVRESCVEVKTVTYTRLQCVMSVGLSAVVLKCGSVSGRETVMQWLPDSL